MAQLAELIAAFENRVAKRFRHLRKWAKREGTDCFRVYDRDIPEVALALDVYGDRALLQQYVRGPEDAATAGDATPWREAVARALERAPETIVVKRREKVDRRSEQHDRQQARADTFEVHEGGLRFLVDLEAHLDTGLFLDHRPLRRRVREEAAGGSVLNLFCYTGSFTVHAAAGGAVNTVSVDLSRRYLDWAGRNLVLNGFPPEAHALVQADVTEWLAQAARRGEKYDLIVLDPPAYSSSKKMERAFDVQRDHPALLADTLALLRSRGVLYFSTNLRSFRFAGAPGGWQAEDIGAATIPEDFRNRRMHHCWRITAAGSGPAGKGRLEGATRGPAKGAGTAG